MYKSSLSTYLIYKLLPFIIGIINILIIIFILFDPNYTITVNNIERPAELSDILSPLIFTFISVLIYFFFSKNLVRITLTNSIIKFGEGESERRKNWTEVNFLIRFWAIFPSLYCIKFENDKSLYFFTTNYWTLYIGFYAFDLSEMGQFIKRKKKDIPLLKIIREEERQDR